MKLQSPWLVEPHQRIRLKDFDPDADGNHSEQTAGLVLAKHRHQLAELQDLLYAGQQRSVLIVLQGMDTAGKDGTISHIFSGVNPQGCDVASFKVPTPVEDRHDFLWRCHAQTPARGMITVFNRSHYEDVLSPVVHKLMPKKQAARHLDEIVAFEQMLADNGTLILKFFLHISKDEQKQRLQARLDDPGKHWKFSEADLRERQFWDEYQKVYADVISGSSRRHAPWFVVPANHKWFRNLVISGLLVDALKQLKLSYPKSTLDAASIKL